MKKKKTEFTRMWVPISFKSLVKKENSKKPLKSQQEVVSDIVKEYEKWVSKARKKRLF